MTLRPPEMIRYQLEFRAEFIQTAKVYTVFSDLAL
jgi:hypothetical protein